MWKQRRRLVMKCRKYKLGVIRKVVTVSEGEGERESEGITILESAVLIRPYSGMCLFGTSNGKKIIQHFILFYFILKTINGDSFFKLKNGFFFSF